MGHLAAGNNFPHGSVITEEPFRREWLYLQIGSQVETLLADCDFTAVSQALAQPRNVVDCLAMATILQYLEGYTDKQATTATQTRADWKYVLHLSLDTQGFDRVRLCEFRHQLLVERLAFIAFQRLVDRIGAMSLFGADQVTPSAMEILSRICQVNEIVSLTEAMLLAIEALASDESITIKGISLPVLYESYAKIFRNLRETASPEDITRLAYAIGKDTRALLSALEDSAEGGQHEIAEVTRLKQIWALHYEPVACYGTGEAFNFWHAADCARCSIGAGLAG